MKKLFRLGMLTSMGRYLPLLATMAASTLLAACSTMRSSVVVEPAGEHVGEEHAALSGIDRCAQG